MLIIHRLLIKHDYTQYIDEPKNALFLISIQNNLRELIHSNPLSKLEAKVKGKKSLRNQSKMSMHGRIGYFTLINFAIVIRDSILTSPK